MDQKEMLYPTSIIEEGKHNIILQNKCGNRLTLLCKEDALELEFMYKPNAKRRKEFSARTFSNRDINTRLFAVAGMPEVPAGEIAKIGYDPFVTTIDIALENGGKNKFTFVNIVDENCFALSATGPMSFVFMPHGGFTVEDGLITEMFTERNEDIVSFVIFDGLAENRYRELEDGSHVVQLCENEVIYVGGEETYAQVNRVRKKLRGLSLEALIQRNEAQIRLFTDVSRLKINNPDFQKVYDINKRINFSMFDEGGVTFGALNRVYYLSWIRDTMMSSAMMALAGTPELLETAYPFVFENPSIKKIVDGEEFREYLQMIGTHWGKSEDDGIFYVLYGLYSHFQTTGSDKFLWEKDLKYIIKAVDYAYEALFETALGIFGSDTLGETTLQGSPFYGFDAVNGSISDYRCSHETRNGKGVVKCYALYHNMNMYNVLKMLGALLKASPNGADSELIATRITQYEALAENLSTKINEIFIREDGIYRPGILVLDDGEKLVIDDFRDLDLWEYAVSYTHLTLPTIYSV